MECIEDMAYRYIETDIDRARDLWFVNFHPIPADRPPTKGEYKKGIMNIYHVA